MRLFLLYTFMCTNTGTYRTCSKNEYLSTQPTIRFENRNSYFSMGGNEKKKLSSLQSPSLFIHLIRTATLHSANQVNDHVEDAIPKPLYYHRFIFYRQIFSQNIYEHTCESRLGFFRSYKDPIYTHKCLLR